MHDITYWRKLQENKFQLPDDADLASLTDELLFYLGSPDGELRDDIAYMAFAHWITEYDVYTLDQLRNLKDVLMMNLQIGIGEQGGNGVLFRSFSILTLALIVYRDNQNSFLSTEEVTEILDKTLEYLQAEKTYVVMIITRVGFMLLPTPPMPLNFWHEMRKPPNISITEF